MKKQAIIGYLVFDEEKPVRRYVYKDGTYYHTSLDKKRGVSLFPNRAAAARAMQFLRTEYAKMANSFDPDKDADQKRCFYLWLKRMKSLRISCVVLDQAEGLHG